MKRLSMVTVFTISEVHCTITIAKKFCTFSFSTFGFNQGVLLVYTLYVVLLALTVALRRLMTSCTSAAMLSRSVSTRYFSAYDKVLIWSDEKIFTEKANVIQNAGFYVRDLITSL